MLGSGIACSLYLFTVLNNHKNTKFVCIILYKDEFNIANFAGVKKKNSVFIEFVIKL